MSDDVTCEYPLPAGRAFTDRSFQTKSLWCGMDRFAITATGRLIFQQCQSLPRGDDTRPLWRRTHVADVDLDDHGELLTYGIDADESLVHGAVRFTHGDVEWVRPSDDLPALHREWLLRVR